LFLFFGVLFLFFCDDAEWERQSFQVLDSIYVFNNILTTHNTHNTGVSRRSRRKSKTMGDMETDDNEKEQRRSILIDRILGSNDEDEEDHHDASEEEEDFSPLAGIERSASQITTEEAMSLVFKDSKRNSSSPLQEGTVLLHAMPPSPGPQRNRMDSDLSSQCSVTSFKSSVLDNNNSSKVGKKNRARRASYLSRHTNSPRVDRRKSHDSGRSKQNEASILKLKRDHKRKVIVSTYKILGDAIESLKANAPKTNEIQSPEVVDEILAQLEIIARLAESVSDMLHLGSVMPIRYVMRAMQRYFLHREPPVRSLLYKLRLLFHKFTTHNCDKNQVRYAVMRATRHLIQTMDDLDVSLKFGVGTFAALSMQRPEIELRWERVEALKLVQQMISIVYGPLYECESDDESDDAANEGDQTNTFSVKEDKRQEMKTKGVRNVDDLEDDMMAPPAPPPVAPDEIIDGDGSRKKSGDSTSLLEEEDFLRESKTKPLVR